jgi:hypothetical protein
MKILFLKLTALIFSVLLISATASAGEFLFETVLDKTISQNTAGKVVGLQGYKEFGVLARFDGGSVNANKEVDFEIGHNQITVVREKVKLNAQGWANFAKVYPVYAPNVGMAVYNPPANLKTKITIYAGH